ncbi:MAG: hypothetical protein ABIG46_03785 [Candidatus Omnitrophota bacterium]
MSYFLTISQTAKDTLKELKSSKQLQKQYKAVAKALKYLQMNPRHQSLQTHEYSSLEGPNGEKTFEAYAEQHTPGAYRIFFYYGPEKGEIVIIAILSHP